MEILEIKIDKIYLDRHSDSSFTILALGEKVKVYYLQLLGLDYVSSTPPIRKINNRIITYRSFLTINITFLIRINSHI